MIKFSCLEKNHVCISIYHYIYIVIYESIDKDLLKVTALKTRGGSGPSGLDIDGWRRILASNSYVIVNNELRKAFAEIIKIIALKRLK